MEIDNNNSKLLFTEAKHVENILLFLFIKMNITNA